MDQVAFIYLVLLNNLQKMMLQTVDFIKMLLLSFWLTMARVINVQLKTACYFQIMVAYLPHKLIHRQKNSRAHTAYVCYSDIRSTESIRLCMSLWWLCCVTVDWFFGGDKTCIHTPTVWTVCMYRHAALWSNCHTASGKMVVFIRRLFKLSLTVEYKAQYEILLIGFYFENNFIFIKFWCMEIYKNSFLLHSHDFFW